MNDFLGSHTIKETPALGTIKKKSLNDMRAKAVTTVYEFLSQEGMVEALARKLRSTQMPLEAEMGRNAALLAQRTYQQAKDQGIELPQSAIWTIPSKDDAPRGVITAAIEAQMAIAKEEGILSGGREQETAEKALMHAAKEGMRAPGIAEGATALSDIFSNPQEGSPVEAQQAANSLLQRVSAVSPPGNEVPAPIGGEV